MKNQSKIIDLLTIMAAVVSVISIFVAAMAVNLDVGVVYERF